MICFSSMVFRSEMSAVALLAEILEIVLHGRDN